MNRTALNRIAIFLFLLVALAAFVYAEAQAQALSLARPFTGAVNKAVASTVGKRLNSMGFAANDPIYGATMLATETVLSGAIAAGSVASTVAAVGSAPVWLSVALAVGAMYEVSQFIVGKYEVAAFPPDPSAPVASQASRPSVQVTSGRFVKGAPVPSAYDGSSAIPYDLPFNFLDPGVGNLAQLPADQKICTYYQGGTVQSKVFCGNTAADLDLQARKQAAYDMLTTTQKRSDFVSFTSSLIPGVSTGPVKVGCVINTLYCPQSIRYQYSATFQLNFQGTNFPTVLTQTFTWDHFTNTAYLNVDAKYSANDLATKLDNSDLSTLVDPELLAAIANKLWQNAAAEPGYAGAPYDVQNPVTEEDILADIAAGLYPHPTNADLLALVAAPGAAPVLDPAAQIQPEASPNTLDLGPDPQTAAPTLEDSPTGESIVSHVMGLLPSPSSFTIPGHVSECQMPSFDFFGTQMTMAGACDLIEAQRALLSTLFSAIWGLAALTTVLRA